MEARRLLSTVVATPTFKPIAEVGPNSLTPGAGATGIAHSINDAVSETPSVTSEPFNVPANRSFTTEVASIFPYGILTESPPLATIDWGDGTSSSGQVGFVPDQFQNIGFVNGTHDYANPGTYNVTTTVTFVSFPEGVVSSTALATVTPAVLSASGVTIQANQGFLFQGVVANAADSSVLTGVSASDYTATIHWGDGTQPTTGTIVPSGGSSFQVIGSHLYAATGHFPVSVILVKPIVFGDYYASDLALASGLAEVSPLSFVVTNPNDSGSGSLRQAILDANLVGGHVITFAIPASGAATIVVTTPLPAITGPTVIDGPSQAAFEGIKPTHPLIEIDGEAPFIGVPGGLIFDGNAGGSVLLSVAIFGFSGAQVQVDAPGVSLLGNLVGLQADGSFPPILFGQRPAGGLSSPYDNGIEVAAPNAVIGGLGFGQGNVISGNTGWGIQIAGASASLASVVGNLIGLDPTGTSARANGLDGVAVFGGAGHEFIGPGNVISGNSSDGVHLLGTADDLVVGNAIGTDPTGSFAIANGKDGVYVDQASSMIVIGDLNPLLGNVVSGNVSFGVAVLGGSTGIRLESNRIGTDRTGERAIGNRVSGVLILDSPDNLVGPGNLVSGNGIDAPGVGIWIKGAGSTGNLVFGNEVGTDLTGEFALGYSLIGVVIDQALGNAVGDGTPGTSNVISGNLSIGVLIVGPGASQNLVAGNRIGTDAWGSKAIANGSSQQGAGVSIFDAAANAIGGPSTGFGNLISGNGLDGVQILGPSSVGNLVEGNGLGTNLSGTKRLGNGEDGLLINDAPSTRVIGNLIAANARNGITLAGPGAAGTVIQGNVIGRGSGGQKLGNHGFGIRVISGTPFSTLVSNINLYNTLGPIRPATVSTTISKEAIKVAHGLAGPASPKATHPRPRAKTAKLKTNPTP